MKIKATLLTTCLFAGFSMIANANITLPTITLQDLSSLQACNDYSNNIQALLNKSGGDADIFNASWYSELNYSSQGPLPSMIINQTVYYAVENLVGSILSPTAQGCFLASTNVSASEKQKLLNIINHANSLAMQEQYISGTKGLIPKVGLSGPVSTCTSDNNYAGCTLFS